MLGIRLREDWVYYALFQYFWVLAVLPKAMQLVCLGVLAVLLWRQGGIMEKKPDKFTLLQLVFLLIYGVSIVVNTIWGEHELRRIFAACNTWAVSFIAVFLYHVYSQSRLNQRRLDRYCFINLMILIALWIIYLIVGNNSVTIFGRSLNIPDYANNKPIQRFLGFLDYANIVVFAILFFYPATVSYLRKQKYVLGVVTVLLFFVILSTNSRSGMVLYAMVLAAYVLYSVRKLFFRLWERCKAFYQNFKGNKHLLLAGVILAAAGLVALLAGLAIGVIQKLIEMRAGSNNMRSLIYQTSLKTMWENSPIIGIGIKDMIGDYPLGSHSTYIGVFYKAGILGGLIYLVSLLGQAGYKLISKNNNRFVVVFKLCMLAVMLLMVFEDLDGVNWCICVFYILLARMGAAPAPLKPKTDSLEDTQGS